MSDKLISALARLIEEHRATAGATVTVEAPALGANPLDDDLPDPEDIAPAKVLTALRDLAMASAATATGRGDLCGRHWSALAEACAELVGRPSLPPPEAVIEAIGTGPSATWLRAQWEQARAKGDTALMAWFADQGRRHGMTFP